MGEYLSIKDFAVRAGVSRQAVYSRLSQEQFKKFIKLDNGKKVINIKALELFQKKDFQSSVNQGKQTLTDELYRQIEKLEAEKQELSKQLTLALQIQAADKIELTELRQQVRLLTAGSDAPHEAPHGDQQGDQSTDETPTPQPEQVKPVKKSFWERFSDWLSE